MDTHIARPTFVGRERQLHNLHRLLDWSCGPLAASQLITGPAGVGKSRLAFEFASHAHTQGYQVLTARCWSAPHSPTYWPWTQILRELLDEPRAVDLTALVLDDPLSASTFELFDAVVTLLRQKSETTGLVLILEDLHSLDPSSATLLKYVSYALVNADVVIIGTARQSNEKLAKAFASHVSLAPFTLCETAQYLGDSAGSHLDQVYAATGGVPLHLEHILSSPPLPGPFQTDLISEPLGSLLRTRLQSLTAETFEVLSVLAVLEQAPTHLIATFLSKEPDHLQSALAQARTLRLIQDSDDTLPTLQFTHQIIAEAVRSLTPAHRLENLHARAAQLFKGNRNHRVQYARHLIQAGPELAAEAVWACQTAASQTFDQLAFEDGIELCELALTVISTANQKLINEQVHISNLLAAALWQVGDRDGALAQSAKAWDLSVQVTPLELRVTAALGPKFGIDFSGDLPQEVVNRCQQVLLEQPEIDDIHRSRLLASLAMAQVVVSPELALETANHAVRYATQSGSIAVLGYALLARCAADLSPDSLFLRLTTAQRVLAIAADTNERALVSSAWFLLLGSLLEQGDIQGIDRELAENSPLVTRFSELQDSRHASRFRCLRAILDGDTQLAGQLLSHALQRAQADNDPDALTVWGAQFSVVGWIEGDLDKIEPVLRQAVQNFPKDPVWGASLAWLWTKLGRNTAAAGLVEKLGPVTQIPRDRNWLASMAILGEVAAHLGDHERMAALQEQLVPYSGRLVPIGLGVACWGPVDRSLGLIAQALGNRSQAIKHHEAAMQLCARTGAQVWLAQAQSDLAALLSQGSTSEQNRAAMLATEALTASTQMDWPTIATSSAQVLASIGSTAVTATLPVLEESPDPKPIVRVLGRFEVVNEHGTVRWTSKRARTLLKILVAHRGSPISRARLLDILWPRISHDFLANRFAVALTTVRRALDPTRSFDLQHFVSFDGEYVGLKHIHLEIDVEEFLDLAHRGLSQHTHDELAAAVRLYSGEAFSDEFAAIWAEPLREEAQTVYLDAAHLLASLSEPARACDLYRSILALDEFDVEAHEGLTNALFSLGAPRQAEVAQMRTTAIIKELEE